MSVVQNHPGWGYDRDISVQLVDFFEGLARFGGVTNSVNTLKSLRISDYYSDFYSNLPVASISRFDAAVYREPFKNDGEMQGT